MAKSATSPADKRVIVIDDDEIIRLSCQQILQRVGYKVETFANGHDGIARLKEIRPPLLVVDIKMPEIDGFQVINIVRKIDPDLVIVVITGYATIETAVDAMKLGAYDFVPKPFTPSELRLIIDRGYERWQLTKESQRLRLEKEEIERKFITLVSHELKSPLVAVKQYLDVLIYTCEQELPPRALEWITRSQGRLGEALNLIHDWLALGKLERGTLCDPSARSDLQPIVEQLLREREPTAAAAGVVLRSELAGELPAVRGDSASLAMLVGNLVGNGIKYNRQGGSVSVRARPDGDAVTLEVEDTGIGIAADCLPRLFEEFYRVKSQATAEIHGTGLGLVICQRIASEVGGTIEVRSREGVGTTVTVRLPIAETGSTAAATSKTDGIAG